MISAIADSSRWIRNDFGSGSSVPLLRYISNCVVACTAMPVALPSGRASRYAATCLEGLRGLDGMKRVVFVFVAGNFDETELHAFCNAFLQTSRVSSDTRTVTVPAQEIHFKHSGDVNVNTIGVSMTDEEENHFRFQSGLPGALQYHPNSQCTDEYSYFLLKHVVEKRLRQRGGVQLGGTKRDE